MRAPLSATLLLLAVAASVAAQTDPRLVEAARAAQEGRGDSARATVQRLLAATPPTDTLYPQILYTQAMVAPTAAEMRRQLQRVTVEYATSSWADDALLRLVQMDYATRQYDAAARNLERLKLDFPASPLLPQASYWAARTYFDSNNPAAACRWLSDGIERSKADIELQNQLNYLYQRCPSGGDTAAVAAAPPARDSARTAPARSDTAVRGLWRVQIAAVNNRKAADDAAAKARKLGLTVVTVQEKGFYKVRVGEYPTRDAAQTAAGSLKAKLGGNPFAVADAPTTP